MFKIGGQNYSGRELGCLTVIAVATVVAIVGIFAVPCAIWSWSTGGEEVVTLAPQRITAASGHPGGHKVWATNAKGQDETFGVENEFWRGYNYSTELYGTLEPGHTYKVWTTGYRLGWMGLYRNIYKAEEVKTSAAQK